METPDNPTCILFSLSECFIWQTPARETFCNLSWISKFRFQHLNLLADSRERTFDSISLRKWRLEFQTFFLSLATNGRLHNHRLSHSSTKHQLTSWQHSTMVSILASRPSCPRFHSQHFQNCFRGKSIDVA